MIATLLVIVLIAYSVWAVRHIYLKRNSAKRNAAIAHIKILEPADTTNDRGNTQVKFDRQIEAFIEIITDKKVYIYLKCINFSIERW